MGKRTVGPGRLPEGPTRIQNYTCEYILKTGRQEESSIFRIPNVDLLVFYLGWDEPGLLTHSDERHSLDEDADKHLSKKWHQHLARDQVGRRSLTTELWEWAGPAHKDGDR